MAVNLSKGGKVSLEKAAQEAGIQGGLSKLLVGLAWNPNIYDGGSEFDLDASVFLLGADGKVRNDNDFVFYGNLKAPGVEHCGDNRTGDGEGDDEVIKVDITQIDPSIERVVITVTIYKADERSQNFGMVSGSKIHVMDEMTGTELINFDLGEDFSIETALVVAEFYKHNNEWKFNAIGSGFQGGLAAMCNTYGVKI